VPGFKIITSPEVAFALFTAACIESPGWTKISAVPIPEPSKIRKAANKIINLFMVIPRVFKGGIVNSKEVWLILRRYELTLRLVRWGYNQNNIKILILTNIRKMI
jgi:hypothetical protein